LTKLREFFGPNSTEVVTSPTDNQAPTAEEKRIEGKIIKVSEQGWGFISSRDIKFTRIFFHWSSLRQDTLNFTQLNNGMRVEFTPVAVPDKGWRAIKIKVLVDEQKAAT
jgi:cold shock CspA family protein